MAMRSRGSRRHEHGASMQAQWIGRAATETRFALASRSRRLQKATTARLAASDFMFCRNSLYSVTRMPAAIRRIAPQTVSAVAVRSADPSAGLLHAGHKVPQVPNSGAEVSPEADNRVPRIVS